MTQPTKGKRSPNYPSMDLGTAVERLQILSGKVGKAAVDVDIAKSYWGYTNPKSGNAAGALSTMIKFGLLEAVGRGEARQVRLTQLALRILHAASDLDKLKAIRDAALTPPLHAELWSKYGGLPDEKALKSHLIIHKGFLSSGAEEFVKQFRSTVSFAKLEEYRMVASDEEEDTSATDETEVQAQPYSSPPQAAPVLPAVNPEEFQLILSSVTGVRVVAPFQLSKSQWRQLERMLNAVKPEDDESQV